MQTQDAPAEIIFKLWPWIEANKNRLIGALVAVIIAAGILYFIFSQKEQREAEASQSLTTAILNPAVNANPGQAADSLTQVAAKYSGTAAAQRAQLQAAGVLFEAGRYPDAQTQFQKFLETNPGGQLAATAQLGVAASLEAQGKLEPAVAAYQKIVSGYSSSTCVEQAEFALGRIAEQQGKLTDAVSHFQNAARAGMGGSLAQEAALRVAEIKAKTPAPAAAPKAAVTPAPAPATAPAAVKPAAKPQ